jgi:hypothetical protein
MSKAAKEQEMNVDLTVNGKRVYIFFEADSYYLASFNADGTKKFKADKVRPE